MFVACDGVYQYGVQYDGHDLNNGTMDKRDSPEECQELCQATLGCVGWEWGQDGDNCRVMYRMDNRQDNVMGLVSGRRDSCSRGMLYQALVNVQVVV